MRRQVGGARRVFSPIFARGSGRTLILAGFAIVVGVVGMSLFAPVLTSVSPTNTVALPNLPPSGQHLLGTDIGGRDVFARVVYGGQFLLVVAVLAVLICVAIGVPIGLASAYKGGLVDRVITLVMDSIYAFPSLVFALLIVIIFGPSLVNYSLAIAVIYIPSYFRVARSQTLQVKQLPYVDAARSVGAGYFSVLSRYIWPNIIPSVVVVATVNFADAILITAGLDFIGIGDLLKPDWGVDLYYGRQTLLAGAWWTIVFSGLMILITALGFSLISEGYAERTNPKLR